MPSRLSNTQLNNTELLSMVEEYPQPLFRLSPNGEIIFLNIHAEHMGIVLFGPHEISIEEFWKHFVSSLPEKWSSINTELKTKHTTYIFNCNLHKSTGDINAFGQDIGEQKSRFNNLVSTFEKFDAAILLEDQNRKIVTANQAFCDMFGIPVGPDFLIGQDCSNSAEENKHHFNDPKKFVIRIDEILREKTIVLNEEITFLDGRTVERDYIPLFVNGQYNGHLWKYTDITSRKNSEKILANREKKFRGIINNFKLGLLEVDPEGFILKSNESFELMSGYSAEELRGKKANDILLDDKQKPLMLEKISSRKIGKEDVYELDILNKSKEPRKWLISGAPLISDDGKTMGSIGIHWDITEIKSLEKALINARLKAEESSRNKAKFLANMSHEIRTPLNGIIGMIEQLSFTNLDANQSKFLEIINSASDTLLTIINDILDVSRIESGKFTIEKTPFSIVETVSKTVELLEHKAKENQNKLTYAIDAKLMNNYIGDSHRINQILFNLVGNSIKFTEKGIIDIHCDLVRRNGEYDEIKISIRDTGIGMDSEFLQRIFREFEQEDTTIARKYGGSGLGLYITRSLVMLMDGKMRIDSAKGIGTLVEITLPFEKFESEINTEKTGEKLNTESLKGAKILVAEDNYLNRIVIKTILDKYGVIIENAENGKIAVEKVRSNKYHLIFMDVQMPEMDGLQATRAIRNSGNTEIPIVGLSANALTEEVNNCLNAGMSDYLIKPYTENELIQIILKWLEKISFNPDEVDLTILRDYVGGDESLLLNVLEAYTTFLPSSLAKLKEGINQKDGDAVRTELHQIKPNLENIKIQPIGGSFNDLSNQIKINGITDSVAQTINLLIERSNRALEWISNFLSRVQ
jgi:two-component system, sensor histidine kinase